MRKVVVAVVLAGLMVVAMSGAALATHAHRLTIVVEGRGAADVSQCADRGGKGFGTGQDHADSTAFHNRVHTGTPGTHAFTRANNPVSVVGGGTCG